MNYVYRNCLANILEDGINIAPRGYQTKELLNYGFTLEDPLTCILKSKTRNLNYAFMVAEWLWILYGREDLKFISRFNINIANYSDDGKTLNGAYGPRFNEQLKYVVDTLSKDHDSRQAVMTIWSKNPKVSKDIPCTLNLQFLIREKKLHLIVNMRSNDAFLGLPYDVFTFCQLLNVLSSMLGVGIGSYHHNAGSMHLYKQHFKLAGKIADERCDYEKIMVNRVFAYELGLHLYLKKKFNTSTYHKILDGRLTYSDSTEFPAGIREHLHFLNNYCSEAKLHKLDGFWSRFY